MITSKQAAVLAVLANPADLADVILDGQYSKDEYLELSHFIYMNKRAEIGQAFFSSDELVNALEDHLHPAPKKTPKATPVAENESE